MPAGAQDMAALPDSIIHASTVAAGGRAVVILGASGSGKSALALTLMAHGARLVADDRTMLTPRDGVLVASAPATIAGRIEARGIGILQADALPSAPVALAVDLDRTETARLPDPRHITLAGHRIRLVHKVAGPHFAPAILQYLICSENRA